MTLSLSGACKWCGENPGTGRPECNRCRRIWLAGYAAARKQAAEIAQDETCDPDWNVEINVEISARILAMQAVAAILAMQPEKP